MTNPTQLELPGLCRALAGKVKRFATDRKGGAAVMFAVALVPMIIAVTAAVDYANAIRIKASLQAAADAGVLAAASAIANDHSESGKEKIAKDTFFANLSPSLLAAFPTVPEVAIDFPAQLIRLTAEVDTNQLLTNFITKSMTIGVEAAAIVDKGAPICVLVFNEHAKHAFNVSGSAELTAEKCAIYVNSDHNEGMRQAGSSKATALAFQVTGKYIGSNYYKKLPIPGSPRQKDPLKEDFDKDLAELDLTTCTYNSVTIDKTGSTPMDQGVYCGGLDIKQGTLWLEPGVHVFRDGVLNIQAGGKLAGKDVTILLTGDSSTRLYAHAGGSMDITAPAEGPFAGIVIAQDPASVPSKENLIIGGGQMDIEGLVYFPTQPLKITGNGEIGSNTSRFAIFADTLSVEGNGILTINIGADYVSAGLPELPEADQTVRLVK
jgi:Flp pilus assembly protein TadG